MLTYISRNGSEILLRCAADCAAAIRKRDLHGDSIVMDAQNGRWMKALEHEQLAALLASTPVEAPLESPTPSLKGVVMVIWFLAAVGPPFVALALGVDVNYVLIRSLPAAAVLCLLGVIISSFVRSGRTRWRMSLVLALLSLGVGVGVLVTANSPH